MSPFSNASEAVYQSFLVQQFQAKGILAKTHIAVKGGEIDILTPDQIIECKALLDRQSLLMALGQLQLYSPFYPKYRLAIAGPLPDAKKFPKILKTAEAVITRIQAIGVEVIVLPKLAKPPVDTVSVEMSIG